MTSEHSNIITLPRHGRMACRRCFSDDQEMQMVGRWQMINDPGAWGSSSPKVLVLGFSKGLTQASAYRSGQFEDVPFKDMRTRLSDELRLLGIISEEETVDEKMVAYEKHLAFGSLIRCSLARMNDKGRLECTGQVMPKAFKEDISSNVHRCAESHLLNLPDTLRLILMLGTTDSYIEGCRRTFRSLHGPRYADINAVSYRTSKVVWTHISHPSGLNGHHSAWMAGDPASKAGRKRHLAMDAIRLAALQS